MKIHPIQTGTVAITTRWREGVGHGRLRLLNTDHAGGLPHFASNEILVSRTEMQHATGLCGRLRGYVNKPWPAWFDPTLIDLPPVEFGPFAASLPLTQAGDVMLIPVPRRSPGQLAVIVEDDDHGVFLAGDSSSLPSHDPETAVRLAERRTVGAVERRAAA